MLTLIQRQVPLIPAIVFFMFALLVTPASVAQQLAQLVAVPASVVSAQAGSHRPDRAASIPFRPRPALIVIHVSPDGSDEGDGSTARPLKSLTRAQAAVRLLNATSSVAVQLAGGTYQLAEPLRFTAADGGINGYIVSWEAADGAHPVISGGTPVTGWHLADKWHKVWAASLPRRADPRQSPMTRSLSKWNRVTRILLSANSVLMDTLSEISNGIIELQYGSSNRVSIVCRVPAPGRLAIQSLKFARAWPSFSAMWPSWFEQLKSYQTIV